MRVLASRAAVRLCFVHLERAIGAGERFWSVAGAALPSAEDISTETPAASAVAGKRREALGI
jgi:hypothetical protein